MPPILIFAATWLAGMVIVKNMNKQTKEVEKEEPAAEKDPKSLQLDALKAIRESAYARWEKRRVYEWQLSISIWTALAAFSGIVLSKEFPVDNKYWAAGGVLLIGGAIAFIHRHFLKRMIAATLGDAELQRWAEKRIFALAFDQKLTDQEDFKPEEKFYTNLTGYGVLQSYITALLALAAVIALLAPRHETKPPVPVQITLQK